MKNFPLYEVKKILNLKDMLEKSCSDFNGKTAFLTKRKGSDEYHPITYSQFKSDVDALGTILLKLGLKGKNIAIIGENRYEWAVSYLAVVNGTGIVVPIDKELPQNEIESLMKRSKASTLIFSDYNKESVLKMKNSTAEDKPGIYIGMDYESESDGVLSYQQLIEEGRKLVNSGDTGFLKAVIDAEAMSILLFTSATTDKSKAVMLSHHNICANLMSMCSMTYIGNDDIFLSVLPIHHTYECTCGFLCPLYRGSAIAYCEGLRHIPKNLQESKATIMLGVPLIFETMYRRIWDQAAKKPEMLKKLKLGLKISKLLRKIGIDVRKKLFAPVHESFGGSIRLLISGAAGIDPAVSKGFRELGLFLIQGYGLTECAPIVALNRDVDFRDNATGLPLPGVDVRIDKPGEGGIGEIIVKGPSVMLGYYSDEEATRKVLTDGWFHTGDLGYMDSDKFVYITGRAKNVIVTKNGKNIFPEEIEALLDRSPYIKESLIFGKNDEVFGDIVVSAIIVPDMERIADDFAEKMPNAQELNALIHKEVKSVNKNLVLYKYIRDFQLRENEFAKTTTKKIKRYLEKTV